MTSRRTFLKTTAAGAVLLGSSLQIAFAASTEPLIDAVAAACRRLGPLGWRQMLLDATGGELDIGKDNLAAELAKLLARIDRSYPGFGDFADSATRGIEPGAPEQSLLYHAFAS